MYAPGMTNGAAGASHHEGASRILSAETINDKQ